MGAVGRSVLGLFAPEQRGPEWATQRPVCGPENLRSARSPWGELMCCEKCVKRGVKEIGEQDTEFCVRFFPPLTLTHSTHTPFTRFLCLAHTSHTPHMEVHSSNKQWSKQLGQFWCKQCGPGWFSVYALLSFTSF